MSLRMAWEEIGSVGIVEAVGIAEAVETAEDVGVL